MNTMTIFIIKNDNVTILYTFLGTFYHKIRIVQFGYTHYPHMNQHFQININLIK